MYKPLRDIFRSSDQKLLLGLSQANVIGMALGGFFAMLLLQRFAALPLVPTLGICTAAGGLSTLRWAGWPLYLHGVRAARYYFRALAQPQRGDIDTTATYRPPVTPTLRVLPLFPAPSAEDPAAWDDDLDDLPVFIPQVRDFSNREGSVA